MTQTTPTLIHARIPVELRRQFAAVANAQDRSFSAELRRAMAQHVKREALGQDERAVAA